MSLLERLRGFALRLGGDPGAVLWMTVVAVGFGFATYVRSQALPPGWGEDHMMILARGMSEGHVYLNYLNTINDVVSIDNRNYQAMSLLPTVPYFAFVPFPQFWVISRFIVSGVIGILAGWLALPVARRYGPGGAADYWLAALGAFGTMLFPLAIEGDFYYLAHLESAVLIFLALIEWKGARRPLVLGALVGLAGLARPTLWIVAVPVGLALLAQSVYSKLADDSDDDADSEAHDRWTGVLDSLRAGIPFGRLAWVAVAFGLPIVGAVALTGWFNYVRFGSPLETGYAIAWVVPSLAEIRAEGLFSTAHVPGNVALFLTGGFDFRDQFPWLEPSKQGQSILLTTPALLIAFNATRGTLTNWVLWGAAILAAIPVFLYYGGGGADTYGYRYAMDFIPFLFPLIAIGLRRHFGGLEKALIALSVFFCCYAYIWQAYK